MKNVLFATPCAYHTSPSMGFSRQEYWSGLPFPSPEDLPDPGTEPGSPALQADALPSEPPGKSYYMLGNVIHNGIKHSRHTLEDIRQENSVLKPLKENNFHSKIQSSVGEKLRHFKQARKLLENMLQLKKE